MKIYIIAGEASGDLHGSSLIHELKKVIPDITIRAWGGERMKDEGAEIVKHYRDLAFMGFTEVIMNLRTIMKNISFCKEDIGSFNPDAVILIDYPGFNLRIAEYVKSKNIPVFYYISPQVWAWKSSRVKKIKEVVDKMFVILPFEKEFYSRFDYEVEYVGHPLPDVIAKRKNLFPDHSAFFMKHSLPDKPVIALLPGSRRQEIEKMLPLMLSVSNSFLDYQFVIAAAPSQPVRYYESFFSGERMPVIVDETYELLSHSVAALVTSGTATLETALLNVPEVVCYKGGTISYFIARSLVKINFISLVNLIMEREVVKELIQADLNKASLTKELKKILDPDIRTRIFNDYEELSKKLSAGGAAAKTARSIAGYLRGKS